MTYPAATWARPGCRKSLRPTRSPRRETAVDGEDGSYGDVDVDVRRAVERVHADHVAGSLGEPLLEENYLLVLLRCDAAAFAAGAQLVEEGFVGVEVELLLLLALDILDARASEDVHEARLVHFAVDLLGRDANVVEQPREAACGFGKFRLPLDDELVECGDFRHVDGWVKGF